MNEHVVDLLALYALDGLEPEERAQVEAHLAGCAACRAEAAREQTLVALLAEGLPAAVPDPRLRAKTLGRIGIKSAKPARPVAPRQPAPGGITLPRWVPVLLSLALAVLAGWNVYLTGQLSTLQRQLTTTTRAVGLITGPATASIDLRPPDGLTEMRGSAYVSTDAQSVVLVVQHLAPLPEDETYQAWLITDNGPVSAGLFAVNNNGWGMTWLQLPFAPGAAIGVSREPAGGSAQPTQVVLVGAQ